MQKAYQLYPTMGGAAIFCAHPAAVEKAVVESDGGHLQYIELEGGKIKFSHPVEPVRIVGDVKAVCEKLKIAGERRRSAIEAIQKSPLSSNHNARTRFGA